MRSIKFSFDTLAEDLKNMRRTTGMTQRQVADELGIARQSITNYENGVRVPDLRILLAIVNLYRYDIYFDQ